ncbi:MAG: bifunctional (p)ppGpp synthetase/guanosine-3',5'-bis(diphosphate) 3'-pyrophosphohydrolase [Candidatus Nealsonbacteria bacterium]|nr:bifunctional (p)ppGpp synthetase/guanosine-3',5'-bis(diphosphate) 3'-pyrophosphohydrolase [Candidatus Nealsonbacteria bacterium]
MSTPLALEKIVENYSGRDKKLILEAFEFARAAHEGQKRFSGEDYITHPLRVALILSHLRLDARTIVAGLLHDVLDDTRVSPPELEKKFGGEIYLLVSGVSRLGKLRLPKQNLEVEPIERMDQKPASLEIENLRRMFFAMAEDIRVILIKLADRTHNMETLEFIPQEKQKRMALETMEIFSPLAGRLGIGTIKTKLENLAFPYLYPKEYQWLKESAEKKRAEAKKSVDRARENLKKNLEKEKIDVIEIKSRLKSYFSLYHKLLRHQMDFDQIYDLVALRVIVKDVKTCYTVLGAIHKYWRPLPGRIKDYIAFPKANSYQSLHTTVICEEGRILEIQIRTPEMHAVAERGICAHWAQKEGVDLVRRGKQFAWIQQLAGWQKENQDAEDFLEGLKIDFFKDRIFVFTPRGDIVDLPEGATPVDFAYSVHSEIGHHCVGAKVNRKIVPLSATLRTGDVVEIIVDKNKLPSRDWLKFVKTGVARSHIKKRLDVGFFRGLQALRKKFFPFEKEEKAIEKETPSPTKAISVKKEPAVSVGGKTGVAFFLAKCCRPQSPDQEIAAYLTKSKGASIHVTNCQNFKKLKTRWPERIMEARWP